MNGLIASAKKIEEYGALLDCVKNTRLPIGMTGLSHIHRAERGLRQTRACDNGG